MGCCSSSPYKICCSRNNQETIRLMTFGLDGAGKTSFVKYILKDSSSDIVPTIGFSSVDLKNFQKFNVQVYDTGGGKNIRDIWINYFPFIHGLVLVIDSADTKRIDQVKEILESVVSNRRIQGKPLLVLINKQDVEGAMDENALVTAINLNSIVNKYKIPTRVESCSLINRWSNRFANNPLLDRGYQWLLGYIQSNWADLSKRVEIETSEQIKLEKEVMRKRIEKFRHQSILDDQKNRENQIKENLAATEAQELILENVETSDEADDDEGTINGETGETEIIEEKVIVQRRISINEPKERTILIFGSLDQLDRIVEEDVNNKEADQETVNNQSIIQKENKRPKSSSYGERRNSNTKLTISRNKIAPL
ncbi:ADP-ribosylation factor-like protein 13B [Tetranychus urticae]|uniref:ADP-ribosylation factor-like protein 13B n=1 Tax=Tetranychus urticae TaxID=32264 RepID=T1L0Y6_TETUR|nr:ADP-ribosylation factor-like protein 13B [Tetranychus urticae]